MVQYFEDFSWSTQPPNVPRIVLETSAPLLSISHGFPSWTRCPRANEGNNLEIFPFLCKKTVKILVTFLKFSLEPHTPSQHQDQI